MPRTESSLWYSLGRALASMPDAGHGASTRSRNGGSRKSGSGEKDRPGGAATGLVTGGLAAVVLAGARRFTRGNRPTASRLARGAFAGAGAAGLILAGRAVLRRARPETESPPKEVGDELLAGAGRGLLYAAILDPYLPGPPLVRGALAGTAEYFAAPHGGIFARLQSLSPIRRIPVLSVLLETGDADEDPFVEFLAYGVALGLLLGDDRD